jgi:TrpR family trp operon transcriptional repressor
MSRNKKRIGTSYIKEICAVLCRIEQPEQMQRFLEEILTPAEQNDLALRWELMRRLAKGVPQRQIAEQLGVSLCKITRGAKILKQNDSVSKQFLCPGDFNEPKNFTG